MLRFRNSTLLLLSVTLLAGSTAATGAPPPRDDPEEEGYANADLLLTTEWLAEHGSDDEVVIVDVRRANLFEAGHVAGAVNIPTSATYDPKARGSIGSSDQIAALLGANGIEAKTHVVIYDDGGSTGAARVFWTLEVYGHERASVIDGGFGKWDAEERETTDQPTEVVAAEYEIGSNPGRLSTLEAVREDVEDPDAVMLDSRSSREWDGGRIPDAVHIEWTQNYTSGDVPVFKSPKDLRALYADQGVTRDKRVHAY